MTRRLNLPDSASVATPGEDGRLFAPSAARNVNAILDLVAHHIPDHGDAMEIASGTGEHILALANAFPTFAHGRTRADRPRIDPNASSSHLP